MEFVDAAADILKIPMFLKPLESTLNVLSTESQSISDVRWDISSLFKYL